MDKEELMAKLANIREQADDATGCHDDVMRDALEDIDCDLTILMDQIQEEGNG